MSLHDYKQAVALNFSQQGFYTLIMAAILRADTPNSERLAAAFPDLYVEVRDRWNAPGGRLDSDPQVTT